MTLFLLMSAVLAQAADLTPVLKRVEESRPAQLDFLKELIRAGERGDEAVQEIVARRFRALGCEVEVLRQAPTSLKLDEEFADEAVMDVSERVSVVGRCRGTGGGRSILLFGHPDSEPVAAQKWTRPPFEGVVEGGRLYGWGIADDLGGVALMAEALQALRDLKISLSGEVILASTASKRNARGIMVVLNKGYRADAAVYLHPAESGSGLREVKAISAGMLRFQVAVRGKPPVTNEPSQTAFAHRAYPATRGARRVMEALEELDRKRAERVRHPAFDAQVGRSTNLLIADVSCGNARGLSRVPAECVIGGTLTFPPGEKLAAVRDEVEDAVSKAAAGDRFLQQNPPEMRWLFGTPGVEVAESNVLYQAVSRAIQAVTGVPPVRYALHSASDIRNPILLAGAPAVGFGPLCGGLAQAGFADEWLDLEDYTRAVKALAMILVEWAR
jgi:acetylornithine deacetylase